MNTNIMLLFCFSLFICYMYSRICLPFQEERLDVVFLHDRFLNLCPIYDMSIPIFVITNICPCIIMVCLYSSFGFYAIEKFWLEYACTMLVKSLTLFLTPLHVPVGYIPLQDSINTYLTNTSETYSRDLFFSGHTVLLFLCILNSTHIYITVIMSISMFVVSCLLLCNRVHYTIDIVMAPFIGFSIYHFIEYIL